MKHIVSKGNFFKFLFIFLISFLSNSLNAQTTIWLEDFTSLADGTTSDAGATAWTRDISGCSFGTGDYFEVQNQMFEGKETNGEGIWYSVTVDIVAPTFYATPGVLTAVCDITEQTAYADYAFNIGINSQFAKL